MVVDESQEALKTEKDPYWLFEFFSDALVVTSFLADEAANEIFSLLIPEL